MVAQFFGNAHWAEPSPLFVHRARPNPLECQNEYLLFALGEEIAVQAVVGSIVWAFRRVKNPRRREMSARIYALHSVCPQISFFFLFHIEAGYSSRPGVETHGHYSKHGVYSTVNYQFHPASIRGRVLIKVGIQ